MYRFRVTIVGREALVSARAIEDAHLIDKLNDLHRKSRCTYGFQHLQSALTDEGHHHGKARISRLMKRAGLRSKHTKRYKSTTVGKHDRPIAPSLLQQNFTITNPNKAWTSDMTYILTKHGWQYLATIMDLYSRRIVGWSIQSHMKTGLVKDALQMTLLQRKTNKETILHSDRGYSMQASPIRSYLQNTNFNAL